MVIVKFYSLGSVEECNISFVVMVTKYQGKLLLVRHRDRSSWEIPGGHIEQGEKTDDAAQRELFEETGAVVFNLTPVCIYSVDAKDVRSFGQIYYAEIIKLGKLPEMEIVEVKQYNELPENLTYPLIQPKLLRKVMEWEDKR
jgi:8-oxo-dGTP diphosphatase